MPRRPAAPPATPTDQHGPANRGAPGPDARLIPAGVGVLAVVVRIAGQVPARLDLTHAGTPEQQLGIAIGQTLLYLYSADTAEAVYQGWRQAGVLAERLPPAQPGRRHPMTVGPSSASVLVRVAGLPRLVTALEEGRAATSTTPEVTPMLRMRFGPLHWQVCDLTAYATMLRVWRQATQLLGSIAIHTEA